MKNAAISLVWGFNAWYAANFVSLATETPSIGPVAAVAAGVVAYLALTRRMRARIVAVPAAA